MQQVVKAPDEPVIDGDPYSLYLQQIENLKKQLQEQQQKSSLPRLHQGLLDRDYSPAAYSTQLPAVHVRMATGAPYLKQQRFHAKNQSKKGPGNEELGSSEMEKEY
jgi:hypothetical protein